MQKKQVLKISLSYYLFISLLFFCLVSYANPGGSSLHNLSCGPVQYPSGTPPIVGATYELRCETKALAPQYSLRGCDLLKKSLYPQATPEKIKLTVTKQTAQRALLVNKEQGIQVNLLKTNFSARVYFQDRQAKMDCAESELK